MKPRPSRTSTPPFGPITLGSPPSMFPRSPVTGRTRWSNGDRPFIMGRFGGLGTHRYPIGFSGDTVSSWETLTFQVEFTCLAANVAYQWGHDIGGHWGVCLFSLDLISR